jgi:DNA-binding LytR/AlgR family response regulator
MIPQPYANQAYPAAQPASTLHVAVKNEEPAVKRVIAKKGREYMVFKAEEVACFFTINGISFMIDQATHTKYIIENSLKKIESSLGCNYFFRANKKYLLHINTVIKYRPCKGGKLAVTISPTVKEEIIISQLKAKAFKSWLLQ